MCIRDRIKDAVANEEKDIAFLQIIKQALVRGVTATVYLCGEGFEGSWFKQSTKALCLGRRVFMSKHLFADVYKRQDMISSDVVLRINY